MTARIAEWVGDLGEQLRVLVKRRPWETAIVVAAMALRFSMLATYPPGNGWDAYDHLVYIQWFATHSSLPPLMLCRETYHPPLYYVIEGAFSRLVHGNQALFGFPSMVFSSVTLLLTWYGLERYLPGQRRARIVGLALAAILPVAVHLSGMVMAEALNGMLATTGLLVTADALLRQQRGQPIWRRAVVVGAILGLQMLAKISALVILTSIGGGVALSIAFASGSLAVRARRAAPWLLVLAAFGATCGWYYVRNQIFYGKAVLSGFDGTDKLGTHPFDTPYLYRRAPEFFYGWDNETLTHPYFPTAVSPRPTFWPVLIATTFVDYYNYSFVRAPDKPTPITGNSRPLRPGAVFFSRLSMMSGVVVALSTTVAWLWSAFLCLRRRQAVYLLFLLAPAFVLVGQLHFVIRYPYDYQGPIKSAYVQFGSAPLFALFGLAVQKMLQRRATWPIGILQCAALAGVAGYTVYARVFPF